MPTLLSPESTISQLVADRPALTRLFERLGIDYCCSGKKTLSDVCADKGLDVQWVLQELSADETEDAGKIPTDWSAASITDLVRHIVQDYHQPLKEELPRLSFLVNKVANAHGERNPDLYHLVRVYNHFWNDLELHMVKEETILFPACLQLESGALEVHFPFGTVRNPIRMMIEEHENSENAFARMRELTQDYTPQPNFCNSYRAMLDGLRELDITFKQHVDLENDVLFPKAIALEAVLVQ